MKPSIKFSAFSSFIAVSTSNTFLPSSLPSIHDHPSYLCCPNALSLVGDPLSGNGCGSPNHI